MLLLPVNLIISTHNTGDMSLGEELCYKAHQMEVEEDFYSYEFSNDEDLPVYKDSEELFAALRQKEDEVLLAAQVGNALLLENRQLKEERDALHDKYTQQLEVRKRDSSSCQRFCFSAALRPPRVFTESSLFPFWRQCILINVVVLHETYYIIF